MQSGESIYDLIPRPVVAPERPAMHRSKYPGDVDPATFEFGDRVRKGTGTFGRSPTAIKPKTDAFLRRTSANELPSPASTMTRTKAKKLPPVPKRDEAPAMGLVSDKNFVKTNALEAMLAKPPKKEAPLLATQKKDYGRVPKYLHTIKSQISAEKEMIAEFQRQQEEAASQPIRPMSEDERDDLLYDMKVKWGKLNEAYGKLSFTLDVPSHMRRKEDLEAEMTQLEKDIKTLQGRQVVVVDERRV